jgi:hypothetical protein
MYGAATSQVILAPSVQLPARGELGQHLRDSEAL